MIHSRAFIFPQKTYSHQLRFLLSNEIFEIVQLYSWIKFQKLELLSVLRYHYGVVKVHSLPHEILQRAGVDEFFKGVELEKKEVELAGKVKEIERLSVGVYAPGEGGGGR